MFRWRERSAEIPPWKWDREQHSLNTSFLESSISWVKKQKEKEVMTFYLGITVSWCSSFPRAVNSARGFWGPWVQHNCPRRAVTRLCLSKNAINPAVSTERPKLGWEMRASQDPWQSQEALSTLHVLGSLPPASPTNTQLAPSCSSVWHSSCTVQLLKAVISSNKKMCSWHGLPGYKVSSLPRCLGQTHPSLMWVPQKHFKWMYPTTRVEKKKDVGITPLESFP